MACTPTEKQSEIRSFSVDELAVAVTPQENREYSYTDKKAGFWYGRTHQDEPVDWYAGWNLAKKRIFRIISYQLMGSVWYVRKLRLRCYLIV